MNHNSRPSVQEGAISIGKDEGKKWGKEGNIFGLIVGPGVAIVLLAEAHVALRVALRHADVVHLRCSRGQFIYMFKTDDCDKKNGTMQGLMSKE